MGQHSALLDIGKRGFVSENAVVQPADKKLRNRFNFYSALLRGQVRHKQMVENKPKAQVESEVMAMACSLVEKYKFGSLFIVNLKKYINMSYNPSTIDVYRKMVEESGLEDNEFDAEVQEMKQAGFINKLDT